MSSNIIQQLQTCHSAVEDLISNLEALRTYPKIDFIQHKIARYEAFLATKQDLFEIFQNNQSLYLIEWLVNNKISSPLVIEIIRR
jgi:TnpA family transposase